MRAFPVGGSGYYVSPSPSPGPSQGLSPDPNPVPGPALALGLGLGLGPGQKGNVSSPHFPLADPGQKEISRAVRASRDLSVALLDLDNFKTYNDTHGHLKGDEALAEIASVIRASIRKGTDSAYRYGGDEFMPVFPETDLKQASKTLDRIILNLENQISNPLTLSIGLALLGRCESVQGLIQCADEAMYQAKKSGGSRIVEIVCEEQGG
ncbi:MAG: GGDEF domain-containing protein [bacterium]|nr:MAG: GGDEF domain-containing protein [bacterium]